ncbi:MAG TPA: hypothetical protein VLL05_20940 [Terriglobales bacterium]|nr:hypothetical protein [Terriglobales bacterium]
MKTCTLLFVIAIAFSAKAQDKPRVFVQGKGSENVSSNGVAGGDNHWAERMEVGKNFQKGCSDVIVTINQANADYIVMMNGESKQNLGLLRSNSQIQIANRAGEIIGKKATPRVGNASKACKLIVADWQAHGRINAQEAPAVPTSPPATAPDPGGAGRRPAPPLLLAGLQAP